LTDYRDGMPKSFAMTNGSSWLDQSPTHLIHRVAQCGSQIFDAGERDLSPRQVAVLSTVAQNEGLSQTDMVALTGIDRSTLAELVARLKKKGLLTRHRKKEDTRTYEVRLTDQGRRSLKTAEPLAKKADEQILAALPVKDRQQFIRALQTIIATLQPRK
jgi:MarR family transcriptional regulator, temperature-dependent positive regulator of motility